MREIILRIDHQENKNGSMCYRLTHIMVDGLDDIRSSERKSARISLKGQGVDVMVEIGSRTIRDDAARDGEAGFACQCFEAL